MTLILIHSNNNNNNRKCFVNTYVSGNVNYSFNSLNNFKKVTFKIPFYISIAQNMNLFSMKKREKEM